MTAEPRSRPASGEDFPVHLFLVIATLVAAAAVAFDDWRLLFAGGHHWPLERDFVIFRVASEAIWRGDLITVFDPSRFSALLSDYFGPQVFTPFPYPPLAVWFVAPLAALPSVLAWPTWLVITFAGFAAALRRCFAGSWQWVLMLVAAPASLVNIASGQNGFLSAALLAGGLLLLERRPIVAGVLIGLLTFKPQLGILLPAVFLAGGYYRAFAGAAATTLLLFAGSVALLGWMPWSLYLDIGLQMQWRLLDEGVGAFTFMVPTFFMAARLLGLPLWLSYAAHGIVAVAVLATCCWAIRRPAPLQRRIALVMTGALLVPPYVFNYDMTILLAAQVIAWPGYRNMNGFDRAVFAMAWLVPAFVMEAGIARLPIAPLILLSQFLVLLRWVKSEAAGPQKTAMAAPGSVQGETA
jgi:hypothetical protein